MAQKRPAEEEQERKREEERAWEMEEGAEAPEKEGPIVVAWHSAKQKPSPEAVDALTGRVLGRERRTHCRPRSCHCCSSPLAGQAAEAS